MADYSKTINFIKDLYGNQDFTPLVVPVFAGNKKKYLNECIDTTLVSSVGKFVDRFEEDMARYTVAQKAVADMSYENDTYPVVYFKSNTTNEKTYEELFVHTEKIDMGCFSSLCVIYDSTRISMNNIINYSQNLRNFRSRRLH